MVFTHCSASGKLFSLSSFLWAFIPALIFLSSSTFQSLALSDAEILLDLAYDIIYSKNKTNIQLAGWNSSNVENLCLNWDRVECDSWGRVKNLSLETDSRIRPYRPIMTGKLPDSIVGLTNLTHLYLGTNSIWGDFPTEMFTLPVIQLISLSTTGLTVRLPSVFSVTIDTVKLDDTNVLTRLSDHPDWSRVGLLDLRYSRFSCPLPASFVEFHRSGGRIYDCTMVGNLLTIDANNFLCGQIPMSEIVCNVFPLAYRPPSFASDNVTVDVQYRALFAGHFIEFVGREVYISAAYSNRGSTRAYRGEYMALQAQPMSELDSNGRPGEAVYNHNSSSWASFISDDPKRVRANLTMVDNLIVEYIFEEKIILQTGKPYLKFALSVYNLGHAWRNDGISPNQSLDVSINFCINYRIPHSLPNGPYANCTTPPAPAVRANCTGSLGNFDIAYSFETRSYVTNATTQKTKMSYDYAILGSVDGTPLSFINTGVFTARTLYPLPSALWLEKLVQAGGSATFPTMPELTQSVMIPVEIATVKFRKAFYYDPDISITLLFNPSEADPKASPEEAKAIQEGLTAGVIAAIVIVCVVVIAGLTVFAVKVFPYLKARQNQSTTPLDDEPDKERPTSKPWKDARTPSKD